MKQDTILNNFPHTPEIIDSTCLQYNLSILQYSVARRDSIDAQINVSKDYAITILSSTLVSCIIAMVLMLGRKK